MEENATKPQNILFLILQEATVETKIGGNLVLKNGYYFVTTEDDVVDVGPKHVGQKDKKWVCGLLLNKQDNYVSVLLRCDTVSLGS